MAVIYFDDVTKNHSYLGGKGFALGLMKNAGFPVPDGLILTELPNELEIAQIITWWKQLGSPKMAIRSSAVGEDSSDQSFAGQNSTYLNMASEAEIKSAITKCFQSMYKTSSSLYREHFLKENADKVSMNVVVQMMVDPLISGVYFSIDPRTNGNGWIVEAIEGLGEDLVSGKKTPWHFEEKKQNETKIFNLMEIVNIGKNVKNFFGVEIDMEWALDKNKNFKVLQARPITALSGKSEEKRMIEEELARLKKTHPKDTIWDGGTFAEWSAPPTDLTFSIWKDAFAKGNAFSIALQKLGYLGIKTDLQNEEHSLLEKIFDRGYVNISMMAPLYFGPIPYHLEYTNGNPKLKFDFSKMNFKTIVLTPLTMLRMVKVSFRLSTERSKWLGDCAKELALFSDKSFRVIRPDFYQNASDDELYKAFQQHSEKFYKEDLVWPLVLITLIESTSQSLKALLKGVIPDKEIEQTMNRWFGLGLHTVTMDMNLDYSNASINPELREHFLMKYGHRGPGELELKNPRWIELKENLFLKITDKKNGPHEFHEDQVVTEIRNLNSYKKQVIEKEWILLKQMLELREKWKMNLLSPYAHLRFQALEIAKRNQIGEEIFWHTYQEILAKDFNLNRAKKRKNHAELSKSLYLPAVVDLKNLESILLNKETNNSKILNGESLSPGLVYGEVRVVLDPDHVETNDWPENVVLVAESTDPGWTGLFLKSKAVIVEKGGVLSHCAIVAREMNLPAISGIKQCHLRFKNGDKVWVDGNNGRITLA